IWHKPSGGRRASCSAYTPRPSDPQLIIAASPDTGGRGRVGRQWFKRGLKMGRAPCPFRQSDLTRAIKAYVKAGIPAERIRAGFDKYGRPIIFVAKSNEVEHCNAWDDAIAALEAR